MLLPGDRIHIPARRLRYENGATEQRHRFRRLGVPSRYRLRLLRQGAPLADVPYLLIIDGRPYEGRTDDTGLLERAIAPDARGGELRLHPGTECEERIAVRLGTLDPLGEITGVQGRLENLGYECQISGDLDDETRAALCEFQEDHELPITGEPDPRTLNALKEAHGS